MSGVRIRFEGLGKRFGSLVALRGVSGEIGPGEVVTVTGPNGSGKSTLLQIVAGLVRPTRGVVEYREGDGVLPRAAWREKLGMAAPALALYEELTALENLELCAALRGVPDARARCLWCLELVGLDPGRRTLVGGYSTGMRQRLKLAQAVLHDPPVLLLDEPGTNLDPEGRDWLGSFVRERAGLGNAVLVATNDRTEMTWGDRSVALGA